MRLSMISLVSSLVLAGSVNANAGTIVDVAQEAGQFNTLIAAAQAAGLDGALAQGESLTVFAPTDEAFAALPDGTVEMLLKPENKEQLIAVLSYHVLPRKLESTDLPGRAIKVRTIKGSGDKTLSIAKTSSGVTVDNANVISADIPADNGVIHVVDTVLLPSN
ncbi:beta-Ig-H3/fasciclin [Pseudovibrio japonicus]|uniref:Beta-Ig-H3/fasciclin n=1 Tax=Pseudovibrio japonicus TaxID=366534 RepID=A0ABQ3E937_9HYPH|nr:fasciclin domain-containing protein [Pseudovibrio japonicus]GHB24946.1 beta-Ig-H3/fasciclin [Pseudovibrio japonicus]